VWLGTAALTVLILVVAASYRLCTGRMAAALVSTLVPIAVGYTIAHYVSLLLTEGPRGLGLLVGAQWSIAAPHPVFVAAIQVAAILVGHVAGVVAAHDRTLALEMVSVGRQAAGPTEVRDSPTRNAGLADTKRGTRRREVRDSPGDNGRRLAEQVPLVMIMIVYTMTGLYLLVIA
jgi:hypothetical protein